MTTHGTTPGEPCPCCLQAQEDIRAAVAEAGWPKCMACGRQFTTGDLVCPCTEADTLGLLEVLAKEWGRVALGESGRARRFAITAHPNEDIRYWQGNYGSWREVTRTEAAALLKGDEHDEG